jgi:hypothetical protein
MYVNMASSTNLSAVGGCYLGKIMVSFQLSTELNERKEWALDYGQMSMRQNKKKSTFLTVRPVLGPSFDFKVDCYSHCKSTKVKHYIFLIN